MRKRRIMEGPERVVCCTLCLCMAVAVFSSVALVYLTALVDMPAKREISSGLSDLPVMCTTVQRIDTDDCDWYSCGEWCLSKSSHCTKLWAQVRKNGTDVLFKGCSNIEDITCQVTTFAQCLKQKKVSFSIASEASYVYILSGKKFIKKSQKQ